jgi:hypothetical protein
MAERTRIAEPVRYRAWLLRRVHTKVCRFPRANGIDTLELFDEPKPSPGLGWIVVRMRAVSLNYRDLDVAAGRTAITRLSNTSSHGRRASSARSGTRSSGTK